MSEEKSVETTEVVETPEVQDEAEATAEPSIEELKALAESKEAELKELKKVQEADEIRQNYLRRIEKVDAKLGQVTETVSPQAEAPKEEFTARDLIALDKAGIEEGSDKASTIQRYIQSGLVANAKEAMEHPGVQGEFAAIEQQNSIRTAIDENADDDMIAQSNREKIDAYKAGQLDIDPTDKSTIELIARANLDGMRI